ncbi:MULTISPECIES: ParB/RepB/Spo0J family partition protein [unclassified Dinoroseobacter]|uniref:ParB/RepB/Spo0J family partition protein n=1 Tax=unclassified Dinoroseobacter TaxID=2620028 RepID=UPI003C7AD472
MAKRKRLTPAQPGYLDTGSASLSPGFAAPAPAEPATGPASIPPIAQVARDSAASAALAEVTAELETARAEGRLIQALPLAAIQRDHLVRDRLIVEADEMAVLKDSLRSRGQQTPIEVVDLGDGQFGLISGWRRVTALGELHAETGEERFARVQALLRTPETSEAAYTAMVEENEIRVGLSPYERARIVAKAVEQGVFPTHKRALQSLFASASRAKRSKIGSFLTVVAALDGALRFPGSLTERLGLRLSKALEADPELARTLRTRLRKAGVEDPDAEAALLEAALRPTAEPRPVTARPSTPSGGRGTPAPEGEEILPGLYLAHSSAGGSAALTLSGPQVTPELRARLTAWLRHEGGS